MFVLPFFDFLGFFHRRREIASILCYPVLGPVEFVINALKQQVKRHRDRKQGFAREIGIDDVTKAVFETLGLDPELARRRIKPAGVARGHSLSARVWVERLGRSQVMAADALGVRPNTISGMLSQLRKEGFDKNEQENIDRIFKSLTAVVGDDAVEGAKTEQAGTEEPRVVILKRKR